MHRHRYFNLWLHGDEELSPLVRASIAERVTLHEWPLSCVQRLTTSDGRRVIYKSQFGPTVESGFYANARSDLLPAAETIYDSDGYVCMLIEFVEGPLLRDLDLPEAELVGVGREVMAQIRDISGELPFVIDISTEQKWWKLVEATLQDLRGLINQGRFRLSRSKFALRGSPDPRCWPGSDDPGRTKLDLLRLVNSPIVDDLERWAFSEPVRSAIRMDPGYLHGDFGGGNVFVLLDGYRVIDWQRPNVGPTDLDLATLLESSGFDPLRFVDEGVVGVMYFLRLHWLTQCAVRWIPEGVKIYDEQIARLASLIRWR